MDDPTNPMGAHVNALSDVDFAQLARAVDERRCREDHGFGTFKEAVEAFRDVRACPSCGNGDIRKDGRTASGIQRYACKACGLRFNALAGSVLWCSMKDFPTWVRFIELMCWNVPIEAAAELCRISHKTAFEWRHRVFAAVDGYQDRIVLRDRVWIDEAYIVDADLTHGYGEARKRGLSKQQLCIAVAIDVRKNPVAVAIGHGKPSSARIREGLAAHIDPSATVVHDKEKAHASLIADLGCSDEAYKADVRDPVYLLQMELVNNLCSWLKRYLWRFTGMSMKNIQSYLNWFVYLFRVNQAKEKWPRVERVVRHLMMADATYRSSA